MDLRRGILVGSVVVSLVPTVAFAHAAYKDSDPKDEATVSSPPSSVWAEYTEPVQEGYLNIYDPCGVRVDDGSTQVTGYRMTVGMSSDRAGTYAVRWKAASAVDPHVTSGTFTFTVTGGQPCDAGDEEDTQEGNDDSEQRNESRKNKDVSEQGAGDKESVGRSRRGDATRENAARVKGTRQFRDEPGRRDRDRGRQRNIELVQSAPTDAERGIWEGIPLDGFLLAMAVAAAIGAAGGRIYANIMGPRR